MPDIFVPRDTTAYTNYLIELFNKNVIREYTLDYYSNHKDKFKNMPYKKFYNSFPITEKMLQDVIKAGTANGVRFKERDYIKSKEFLKLNIKAYIAKSIYGNKGFYPILNNSDEIYVKSLHFFKKAAALETLKEK